MVKIWKDHTGLEVPDKYVDELDKKAERFSLKVVKEAQAISAKLKNFKTELLMEAEHIYLARLEKANIDSAKRKGNMTICSFDKRIKIEVSIQERFEFDDNLALAQEKLREYLRVKLAKSEDLELTEIVNSAFCNSNKKLDNNRIFSLFRYKIKHPLWVEAIDLIRKSMQLNSTKRYVQIWVKDDQGAYKAIDLSMSTL